MKKICLRKVKTDPKEEDKNQFTSSTFNVLKIKCLEPHKFLFIQLLLSRFLQPFVADTTPPKEKKTLKRQNVLL